MDLFFQAFLPGAYFFPGLFELQDQVAIGQDVGVKLLGQKAISCLEKLKGGVSIDRNDRRGQRY